MSMAKPMPMASTALLARRNPGELWRLPGVREPCEINIASTNDTLYNKSYSTTDLVI